MNTPSTALDPWFKTTLTTKTLRSKTTPLDAPFLPIKLDVPHDVFSTQRIDEGTELLLENLPESHPNSILDMGCGYGALGLPIAVKYKDAKLVLVDRDLLAVQWAHHNAKKSNLDSARVSVLGSLGFRDLSETPAQFDWILCNVPARIGKPFIANLLTEGLARLTAQGEIRLVVILDLLPLIQEVAIESKLPVKEIARGNRHAILNIKACETPHCEPPLNVDLYFRDQIEFNGEKLDRPFDLGGDDPRRLRSGLPALWDALPKSTGARVFQFRCGYGAMATACAKRWPGATIIASDRDLLATTFARRNAANLNVNVDVRESAHFPELLKNESAKFDLVFGELSPSAGEAVALAELKSITESLSPKGQALILCLEKNEKDWIQPYNARTTRKFLKLLSRDGYAVLQCR